MKPSVRTITHRLPISMAMTIVLQTAPGPTMAGAVPQEKGDAEKSLETTPPPLSYLGALVGGNSSTHLEGRASPTFGLTLGIKLSPSIGIGILGSYFGQTSSGSLFGLPSGTSTGTVIVAGQFNYFLGGFHAGAEVGTAISSWSGRISTVHAGDSVPAVIFGPVAGYDLVLGKSISFGAEGHFLVSTVMGGVDNLQLFAVVKIWQ